MAILGPSGVEYPNSKEDEDGEGGEEEGDGGVWKAEHVELRGIVPRNIGSATRPSSIPPRYSLGSGREYKLAGEEHPGVELETKTRRSSVL